MPDRVILQVNAAIIKAKIEKYGVHLTFKDRNNNVFAWGAEDNLNELIGNNPQVTQLNIPSEFPEVLLESDHDRPTAAVETPVVNNNSAAAGAATNAAIQYRDDDPSGYQPPFLIVDYKSSDSDENNNKSGNSAGMNVLHVDPLRELPADEPIQAPDSN